MIVVYFFIFVKNLKMNFLILIELFMFIFIKVNILEEEFIWWKRIF